MGCYAHRAGRDLFGRLIPVSLVFGIVNAFIGPAVKLLSLPLIIPTLGLFALVVNALLLWLTSALSETLGLGFHVSGFWAVCSDRWW